MLKKLMYIYLLFSLPVIAQKEGANWYFGNQAGLNFNLTTPTALTDGQMSQMEGCAALSDIDGNLLFYTSGLKIWNANHQIMLNGDGLAGGASSTQSAILIPVPGSDNEYYIFTVGAQNSNAGLQYSKINMDLDDGLGGVVVGEKNIQLTPQGTQIAEKLTATYHANGEDIWVVIHALGSNEFMAHLVTDEGISAPVITAVGEVHIVEGGGIGAIGYLKASPNGEKFALAVLAGNSLTQLFNFDNETGILTDPMILNFYPSYGVEFSPDSKVLYVTANGNNPFTSPIYQYDITLGTEVLIQQSETIIASSAKYGALQVGIDGKIYVAQNDENTLSVINNPGELGNGCNFVEDSIVLNSDADEENAPDRKSRFGLPTFLQNYFQFELVFDNLCYNSPTKLKIETHGTIASANWSFGDTDSGDDNTSTDIEPIHIFSAPGNYEVSVNFVTGLGHAITLTDTVNILASPVAHEPQDMFACDDLSNDGFAVFDLSTRTATILGDQNPDDYTVTYYLSEELAIAGEEPLPAGPYTNTENPQTIYARLTNTTTGCYDITTFDLVVTAIPTITDPDDLLACEAEQGEGIATFDLTQAIPQITGGNDGLQVAFYSSPAEMAGNQPITTPASYTNVTPGNETILFTVSDQSIPDCTTDGELDLVVSPLPDLNGEMPDYILCDTNNPGDGIEAFDLTTKYGEIANEPGLELVYSYEQGGNMVPITTPESFENTVSGEQTIFVATQNVYNCEQVTHFTIRVAPAPDMDGLGPFHACETAAGEGEFDLWELTTEITGGEEGYQVAYYESEQDALEGDTDTALPMTHTSLSATIWVRVTHMQTGCVTTGSLDLVVQARAVANPVTTSFVQCDTDGDNDGLLAFDLTLVEVEVLGSQDPDTHDITYHTSLVDAQSGEDPIATPSVYQSETPNLQQIWVRIVNTSTLSDCHDVTSFFLNVEQLPQPALQGGTICVDPDTNEVLDTHLLDTGLDSAGHSFVWYQDGEAIPGASGATYEVTQPGSYSVVVTTIPGGCVSQPLSPVVTVTRSDPAIPTSASYTVTDAFTQNQVITVIVEGQGEYLYSLDHGPYQESNVFTNVGPGLHRVRITNASGDSPCDTFLLEIADICIIDYPKFFTPNGDGYNDIWNISGLCGYPEAMIYIFDRYGKLIKQLSSNNSQGWDGTYNGSPLPATDYWFTVSYQEGGVAKEFRAHFSLKR